MPLTDAVVRDWLAVVVVALLSQKTASSFKFIFWRFAGYTKREKRPSSDDAPSAPPSWPLQFLCAHTTRARMDSKHGAEDVASDAWIRHLQTDLVPLMLRWSNAADDDICDSHETAAASSACNTTVIDSLRDLWHETKADRLRCIAAAAATTTTTTTTASHALDPVVALQQRQLQKLASDMHLSTLEIRFMDKQLRAETLSSALPAVAAPSPAPLLLLQQQHKGNWHRIAECGLIKTVRLQQQLGYLPFATPMCLFVGAVAAELQTTSASRGPWTAAQRATMFCIVAEWREYREFVRRYCQSATHLEYLNRLHLIGLCDMRQNPLWAAASDAAIKCIATGLYSWPHLGITRDAHTFDWRVTLAQHTIAQLDERRRLRAHHACRLLRQLCARAVVESRQAARMWIWHALWQDSDRLVQKARQCRAHLRTNVLDSCRDAVFSDVALDETIIAPASALLIKCAGLSPTDAHGMTPSRVQSQRDASVAEFRANFPYAMPDTEREIMAALLACSRKPATPVCQQSAAAATTTTTTAAAGTATDVEILSVLDVILSTGLPDGMQAQQRPHVDAIITTALDGIDVTLEALADECADRIAVRVTIRVLRDWIQECTTRDKQLATVAAMFASSPLLQEWQTHLREQLRVARRLLEHCLSLPAAAAAAAAAADATSTDPGEALRATLSTKLLLHRDLLATVALGDAAADGQVIVKHFESCARQHMADIRRRMRARVLDASSCMSLFRRTCLDDAAWARHIDHCFAVACQEHLVCCHCMPAAATMLADPHDVQLIGNGGSSNNNSATAATTTATSSDKAGTPQHSIMLLHVPQTGKAASTGLALRLVSTRFLFGESAVSKLFEDVFVSTRDAAGNASSAQDVKEMRTWLHETVWQPLETPHGRGLLGALTSCRAGIKRLVTLSSRHDWNLPHCVFEIVNAYASLKPGTKISMMQFCVWLVNTSVVTGIADAMHCVVAQSE
jgi:hypothetical protein